MANSRIGAEQLTLSKVLTDTSTGTTYDTPFAITKKLITIGVKNSSSADPQYADDQTVDVYVDDGDIEIEMEITDLTEDEKAIIFGQTMSAGIRTPSPSDVKPYFSVSWKSKKRDGTYKYYKVLKVLFSEPDEDFETKKEKLAPQTDKITGIGIQRIYDGIRKRIADASSTTYVSTTGTNWFTTGDINPDITPPTVAVAPADTTEDVAIDTNIVWTFDKAILPSCVTASNFIVIKADGTAVAGALSIGTSDTVVTFNPTENLANATDYISIATTGITDKSANHLANNCVANFKTVAGG